MNATSTQRQTANERRDAIVVAALREFAASGYSGTSTESIARAVGVSQPYLFQLFGTKRELFLAVVRHGFQRTRLVFHEAAKRGPEDDPTCSILDLMGLAYMRLLADRDLLRVQLQAYAACGAPLTPEQRAASTTAGGQFLASVPCDANGNPLPEPR